MKKVLFIVLVLICQTVFSQTQPVTVLSQKWGERQDLVLSRSDNPFSAANGQVNMETQSGAPRQTVDGARTNKYFAYETVVRNDSKQNIYGLSWDYVFYDAAGTVEKARKKFVLTRKIKPQKKETLLGKTSNPPDLIVDARDFEKGKPKYLEKIEINCVIFEDGTLWKREGVDDKACEELKNAIKKRKDRARKI